MSGSSLLAFLSEAKKLRKGGSRNYILLLKVDKLAMHKTVMILKFLFRKQLYLLSTKICFI